MFIIFLFIILKIKRIEIGIKALKYLKPYPEAVVCHKTIIPKGPEKITDKIITSLYFFVNISKKIDSIPKNKTGLNSTNPNSVENSRTLNVFKIKITISNEKYESIPISSKNPNDSFAR